MRKLKSYTESLAEVLVFQMYSLNEGCRLNTMESFCYAVCTLANTPAIKTNMEASRFSDADHLDPENHLEDHNS